MSNKKYELIKSDTKEFLGRILYRVKYLRDSEYFSKGDLGGYIEKEANLSQEGNARVFGNARVSDDAWISGNTCVSGNARISGNACVSDDAWISGNTCVSGNARISGDAWISGNARVFGDAWISGNTWVFGDVKVDCVLCSRFSFRNQAQIDKWLELEEQFEEIKDTLKDKPKRLEDLSKQELIEKIKELKEGVSK